MPDNDNLTLDFFPSNELEPQIINHTENDAQIIVRNALRVLMMGWQDCGRLISLQSLYAILIKRDPELLRAMRLEFQNGFDYIHQQLLQQTPLSPSQQEQVELYLSNALTLLPYSDLNPYEFIGIPQYIDNKWKLVEYKVTPIELTPTKGFEALFIEDKDRVFAYGLEPISEVKARSHLIFMGTTYPAGQGFVSQVGTDLEAFETAGKRLYRTGRKKITEWLDAQPLKPHVCGVSLGGSLSLLLAIDQGDKLERVDALNPAGLYRSIRKSKFDHWDNLDSKPKVVVQKQGNDPVSYFGAWKEDWQIFHVEPPQDKRGPNAFTDHFLNYAGLAGTRFTKLDTKDDNESRITRNRLIYTGLRSFVYLVLFIPFRYLVLPVIRYLLQHKLQTALIVAGCLVAAFFPLISLGLLIKPLSILLSGIIMGFLAANVCNFSLDTLYKTQYSELSQFINWSKQQSLATQLSIGLVGVIFVAAAILTVLFPVLLPISPISALFILAAIPPTLYCLTQLSRGIHIMFGWNQPELAKCHKPTELHNDSLLLSQEQEQVFDVSTLQTYDKAKQAIIANYTPILSRQSEDAKTITLTLPKAKIQDINASVALVNKFSFFDDNAKAKLVVQQKQYELISGHHSPTN